MFELMNGGTPPDSGNTTGTQAFQQQFSELDLLRLTLNQVDYGLVVVDVDSRAVQYANALGHDALEGVSDSLGKKRYNTGLCLLQGRVVACRPADADPLHRALERTRIGVRELLSLSVGNGTCVVALVPLSAPKDNPPANAAAGATRNATPPCHALLVFAKQQLCDSSTVALFARDRGLTSAEGQVLVQVCSGLRPAAIARRHGVQISTVRTQLRNIRVKTCCETIGELIQKVSVLPPMARHLSGNMAGLAWQ